MKKVIIISFLLIGLFPYSVKANNEIFENYIVMDIESKRIFYEKAKDIKILPASTTKIMTALVAIENSNLSDVVKVGDEILTIDGANIYEEIGENILMQDLLYGMILRSGNDAAMTIARHTSGSVEKFVKLMNEKSRKLNLKNTIFNNPTGLDDNEKNYSSVHDLALLYSSAYKNKTFREIIGTLNYKASSDKKSYYFINRSKIISMDDRITGAKTGYTPQAGRVLVSSAKDNDLNIVISTKGNDYGYKNHINFYNDIFNKYKKYKILDNKTFKINSKLKGNLYIKNSFSYPLAKDEIDKISKKIVFNKKKEGIVGEVLIYFDNDLIHKESVYLKKENQSFISKIKQFFSNLVA